MKNNHMIFMSKKSEGFITLGSRNFSTSDTLIFFQIPI